MNSTRKKKAVKNNEEDSVAMAARDAIMADGDLNKLLQLAHHCSSQQHPRTQSVQDDQVSSSANEFDKESVLAASSLHLPLIDSRSILQSAPASTNGKGGSLHSSIMDCKVSSVGRRYEYADHAHEINGNGCKTNDEDNEHICANTTNATTEKALLSLKHHTGAAASTTTPAQAQTSTSAAAAIENHQHHRRGSGRTSSKNGAHSKKQSVRKPRSAPNKKKARQKQMNADSQNGDSLNSALLRGVTMRPSGKWQAQLYYAGKSRYIGVFDTREKAATAYEIAREMLKRTTNGDDEAAQTPEQTESAVAAARKAAFEGVNRK